MVPPHHGHILADAYAGPHHIIDCTGKHNSVRPQHVQESVSMFIKATFKWPQQPVELCYTTITKRTADADAAQVRAHYHTYYNCCFTASVASATAAAIAAMHMRHPRWKSYTVYYGIRFCSTALAAHTAAVATALTSGPGITAKSSVVQAAIAEAAAMSLASSEHTGSSLSSSRRGTLPLFAPAPAAAAAAAASAASAATAASAVSTPTTTTAGRSSSVGGSVSAVPRGVQSRLQTPTTPAAPAAVTAPTAAAAAGSSSSPKVAPSLSSDALARALPPASPSSVKLVVVSSPSGGRGSVSSVWPDPNPVSSSGASKESAAIAAAAAPHRAAAAPQQQQQCSQQCEEAEELDDGSSTAATSRTQSTSRRNSSADQSAMAAVSCGAVRAPPPIL
eukprot:4598-Heterococcus_DN1.PRE.2